MYDYFIGKACVLTQVFSKDREKRIDYLGGTKHVVLQKMRQHHGRQ